MNNIDIDHIIEQIKKQALLHKSVDVEEYKRNFKFLSDQEEINTVSNPGSIFRVGKKIDMKLYDNSIYKKIRPQLVKIKRIIKNDHIIIDLDDLLKYDDIQFIEILYRRLLNREADDEGLLSNANILRLNKLTKIDVIKSFIYSEEYIKNHRNIRIKKLRSRYILQKIQHMCGKIPLLGYIINIIIEILMLPKRVGELEEFRRINSVLINENKYNITDIRELLKRQESIIMKLKEMNSKYTEENKKLKENICELQKESELATTRLERNLIELINKVNKIQTSQGIEISSQEQEDTINLDEFYIKFEDKFRGQEELISERLNFYINKLKQKFKLTDNIKLLDLGCGRGEWVSKLVDNGFINVIGVDLNGKMIDECKEKGLNVIYGNAIDYLKLQPDSSIDFISGFQIIEHLDFKEKMQFVQQSYRVLKKQGVLLLETPNPENVLVGSCNFYTDLTHKNPVHPETLKFVMEQVGFEKNEIIKVNPLNYVDQALITGEMKHIAFRFNMEQDYSVWGEK